jgi:hypothetical protein
MAHQCLQCGKGFPDGSSELLKGCPQCQGTRFFYTQAPLARPEREALMRQANHDLRAIIEELVQERKRTGRGGLEGEIWSREARERWLQVDARKLRAHEAGAVREVGAPAGEPEPEPWAVHDLEPAAPAPLPHAPRPTTAQAHLPVAEEPPRARPAPKAEPSKPKEAKPEVVVVQEPGRYDIDVEQLLDKSPIVVRRDGVYVVHLPSVFQALGAKK